MYDKKATNKRYYENHKETVNKRTHDYYYANRETLLEKKKEYDRTHPRKYNSEKRREKYLRRRKPGTKVLHYLTADEKAQIIALYELGVVITEISRFLKLNRSTVYKFLKRHYNQ